MSKTDSPDTELPGRVMIGLQRDQDIQQWLDVKQHIAEKKDSDPESVGKVDVIRELMEYYQFHRLNQDQRIREARHAVAEDHDVTTDDVSLRSLLKVTSAAYLGYQQTSDWRPSENGDSP